MRISRYAPLEHPLAHQFQRAIESLTAALAPDSARQYRGATREFLIYLGEDHPTVASLNQLRRDPHILGWFVASCFCAAFCRSSPGLHNFPNWLI
jgi:hypothetical protein